MPVGLLSNATARAWLRVQSLFVPSVPLTTLASAVAAGGDPREVVLQLYTWERDRLLNLAKGLGAAAVTVLAALIADATRGDVKGPAFAAYAAGTLVALLILWAGFILTGLWRLASQYAIALELVS